MSELFLDWCKETPEYEEDLEEFYEKYFDRFNKD